MDSNKDMMYSNWMQQLTQEDLRSLKRKYWTFVLWVGSVPITEQVDNLPGMTDNQKFALQVARNLANFPIPALVSPVHEFDKKDDGTLAVPHVHVIVFFEQPQRYKTALAMMQVGCDFHTLVYMQPVANLRSMQRYLVHLDNPEKVQYDVEDVIEVGGAEFVIESETASEICVNAIIDEQLYTFTQVMHRFSAMPSVKKWALSNVGAVRILLSENRERACISPSEHILSDIEDEPLKKGSESDEK